MNRKKGFWGKRRVRRPTLVGGGKKGSQEETVGTGTEPSEVPRDAPGGGNVQGAKKGEAQAPPLHERMAGDDYADDATPDQTAAQHAAPEHGHAHLPHLLGGTHYDKAVWAKESWEDLKVGDFVRLRGDESVPAGALRSG